MSVIQDMTSGAQDRGASTGFVSIDFVIFVEIYLKFFADHAAEEEGRRRDLQAGLMRTFLVPYHLFLKMMLLLKLQLMKFGLVL